MSTATLARVTDHMGAPFVFAQQSDGLDVLLASHTAWVRLPSTYADLLRRINELTGWSFRDIAEVVGTSHTTVGKLANGAAPSSRSAAAVERIERVLDVLTRVFPLVGSRAALAPLLEQVGPHNETPRELLAAGAWSEALLAALDLVDGPRLSRPTLRPVPRRERATRELH